MTNKSSVSFSKKDIGAAVVFKGFDGGSYSATVSAVSKGIVSVVYFPGDVKAGHAVPSVVNFVPGEHHRITRFPVGSSFLVV